MINKNKITSKTLIVFLKVFYNVAQIKEKKITFEQYSRIHLTGPKIAICETSSNAVFVLNSSFTSKDQYFHIAIQEAITAFNNILQDFGYTQTLEYYDPNVHQAHPPPQHPLFQWLTNTFTHLHLLFNYISSSLLHLPSMMSRDVVDDHSSKELRWHFSLLHAHPPDVQHHPSSLGSSTLTICFCLC